ncbi:MAG: hypothetical protein M3P30_14270 [Chloroflexota bacterium]|nr:hypothetical protein [Chloroflexota bacterium]
MPYEAGSRLPGERASRLGHLDVLKSPLVRKLCESFEDTAASSTIPSASWELPPISTPLPLVFAVDGSLQIIENALPPHKTLAFVKTALLRVDRVALAAIDPLMPHPLALRELLIDSAMYHATAFPMRHVAVAGMTVYDAVRQVIFESVKDPTLQGEVMETLKWLAYEKWDGQSKNLPPFQCPHCDASTSMSFDNEVGPCDNCSKDVFLTDMLGFHLEMADDAAPDSIASSYMLVHETLMLFTGVRYFWEQNRTLLSDCLFLKDGPLAIRAQYSKLVAPIRRFFEAARSAGVEVCMVGQEKTGAFVEHLNLIGPHGPDHGVFLPGHDYIRSEVQHRPIAGDPYGLYTNYGAKVFTRFSERHQAVLTIPTGKHLRDPASADLIGAARIFATLPALLSSRFEGGLFPIELANNVASLSTYPSAKVLALFAQAAGTH